MHVDKIRSPVNLHPNHDCSAKKWMDLEAQIFAHMCMLTSYLRLTIFNQILDVLDLQFQGSNIRIEYISKFIRFLSTR